MFRSLLIYTGFILFIVVFLQAVEGTHLIRIVPNSIAYIDEYLLNATVISFLIFGIFVEGWCIAYSKYFTEMPNRPILALGWLVAGLVLFTAIVSWAVGPRMIVWFDKGIPGSVWPMAFFSLIGAAIAMGNVLWALRGGFGWWWWEWRIDQKDVFPEPHDKP